VDKPNNIVNTVNGAGGIEVTHSRTDGTSLAVVGVPNYIVDAVYASVIVGIAGDNGWTGGSRCPDGRGGAGGSSGGRWGNRADICNIVGIEIFDEVCKVVTRNNRGDIHTARVVAVEVGT